MIKKDFALNHINLPKPRVVLYDLMRSLAVLAIVWMHALDTAVIYNRKIFHSALWVPLHAMRIGVPFFLMISGALLLPKLYPKPLIFYQRRVLQFVIMIIVVSFIENKWYVLLNGNHGAPWFFNLRCLLEGNPGAAYQLWYLYCAIILYLLTPFLASLFRKLEIVSIKVKRFFLLTLFSVLIVSVILIFKAHNYAHIAINPDGSEYWQSILSGRSQIAMNTVVSAMYFLAGYIFTQPLAAGGVISTEKNKQVAFIFLFLGIFSVFAACGLIWHWGGDYFANSFLVDRCSPFIFCSIAFFFLALWKMPYDFSPKMGNFLRIFGTGSFSVFLYHLPWIMFGEVYLAPHLSVVPLIFIYFIGALVTGFIPYFFLKNVPYLRKLVV